ncbi:MAG: hypothetical protein JW913_08355 [Chitinispirillaceae bacterium]|nr:hypothetical protein [Chitinispirillaceae bacterium]
MVHQLIAITESIDPGDTVWAAFDRKLEEALNTAEIAASIKLRGEMGHGLELIRWLEGWNLRFKHQRKTLISIAEDPVQLQCLELSHPDMELTYCSSINTIPKMLLNLTPQDSSPEKGRTAMQQPPAAADEEAPVVPAGAGVTSERTKRDPLPVGQPVDASVAATESSSQENGAASDNDAEIGVVEAPAGRGAEGIGYGRAAKNGVHVPRGAVIEIAGEYRCDACGATRMFCKGDIVDQCENRECVSSSTGFSLLFDLF